MNQPAGQQAQATPEGVGEAAARRLLAEPREMSPRRDAIGTCVASRPSHRFSEPDGEEPRLQEIDLDGAVDIAHQSMVIYFLSLGEADQRRSARKTQMRAARTHARAHTSSALESAQLEEGRVLDLGSNNRFIASDRTRPSSRR